MMWARKRWTRRVFAALLTLSILPTLVVPSSRATGDVQFGSYERWIRAQLLGPADALVEQAIADAVESGAKSFDEFIAAFLDAYAEAAPGQPISQVFTDRDLSDDALISYLQRRYSQIADEGILPRVYVTSFVQNLAVAAKWSLQGIHTIAGALSQSGCESFITCLVERIFIISFRTLSSARSLGP